MESAHSLLHEILHTSPLTLVLGIPRHAYFIFIFYLHIFLLAQYFVFKTFWHDWMRIEVSDIAITRKGNINRMKGLLNTY